MLSHSNYFGIFNYYLFIHIIRLLKMNQDNQKKVKKSNKKINRTMNGKRCQKEMSIYKIPPFVSVDSMS